MGVLTTRTRHKYVPVGSSSTSCLVRYCTPLAPPGELEISWSTDYWGLSGTAVGSGTFSYLKVFVAFDVTGSSECPFVSSKERDPSASLYARPKVS